MIKDYKLEDDITEINSRISDLKRLAGVSISGVIAELYKAKAQLINTQMAVEGMQKYEEMRKEIEGGIEKMQGGIEA